MALVLSRRVGEWFDITFDDVVLRVRVGRIKASSVDLVFDDPSRKFSIGRPSPENCPDSTSGRSLVAKLHRSRPTSHAKD